MSVYEALLEERARDAEAKLLKACDEICEHTALTQRLRAHIKLLELEANLASKAVDSLVKMNEDVSVECAFWKAAAERALRLWEREAERADALCDGIEIALSSSSTALSHDNWTRLETLLDE